MAVLLRKSLGDLRRLPGLIFGLGTQACFAITVVSLFEFLRFGGIQESTDWLAIDMLLAFQFAIPHSLMLHPAVSRRLKRWIPSEFYGLVFCLVTCGSLHLLFQCWQTTSTLVWDLTATGKTFILCGFYGSWVMLFYSLYLSGLGYQTGLTPWLYWWNGKRLPRREFEERSLYRWFRHPIYLSFLGLIWFVPTMTLDHAVLTGVWTVYIFIGSWLKDERLEFFLGDSYRNYRGRVPGYPIFVFPKSRSEGMEVSKDGELNVIDTMNESDQPRLAA
ncbi:MAG: hypothetical protein JNL58_11920 [Planctomyces sp.]|nr:hypothetical protein [Planctomyces sp.]